VSIGNQHGIDKRPRPSFLVESKMFGLGLPVYKAQVQPSINWVAEAAPGKA
jgi:hypothetical protein